jgi:hypothetical protein
MFRSLIRINERHKRTKRRSPSTISTIKIANSSQMTLFMAGKNKRNKFLPECVRVCVPTLREDFGIFSGINLLVHLV